MPFHAGLLTPAVWTQQKACPIFNLWPPLKLFSLISPLALRHCIRDWEQVWAPFPFGLVLERNIEMATCVTSKVLKLGMPPISGAAENSCWSPWKAGCSWSLRSALRAPSANGMAALGPVLLKHPGFVSVALSLEWVKKNTHLFREQPVRQWLNQFSLCPKPLIKVFILGLHSRCSERSNPLLTLRIVDVLVLHNNCCYFETIVVLPRIADNQWAEWAQLEQSLSSLKQAGNIGIKQSFFPQKMFDKTGRCSELWWAQTTELAALWETWSPSLA